MEMRWRAWKEGWKKRKRKGREEKNERGKTIRGEARGKERKGMRGDHREENILEDVQKLVHIQIFTLSATVSAFVPILYMHVHKMQAHLGRILLPNWEY